MTAQYCAFILIEDALVIIFVPLRDVSIINVFSQIR